MLPKLGYNPETTPKALVKAIDALNKRIDNLEKLEAKRDTLQSAARRWEADPATDRTEYFEAAAEAALEEASIAQQAADIHAALNQLRHRQWLERQAKLTAIEQEIRAKLGVAPDAVIPPAVMLAADPRWWQVKQEADALPFGDTAAVRDFTRRATEAGGLAEHYRQMAEAERQRIKQLAKQSRPRELSPAEVQLEQQRKDREAQQARINALLK